MDNAAQAAFSVILVPGITRDASDATQSQFGNSRQGVSISWRSRRFAGDGLAWIRMQADDEYFRGRGEGDNIHADHAAGANQ
jgi:hypothetical protein